MVDVELDIVAAERRREVCIDIVRGGRRARQLSLKNLDTVALEVEPGELRVGGCGAYTNSRRRETFGMELSRVM